MTPTPVFLPGEFHGQRSLACYSPWGRKELDKTEQLTHTCPNNKWRNWVGIPGSWLHLTIVLLSVMLISGIRFQGPSIRGEKGRWCVSNHSTNSFNWIFVCESWSVMYDSLRPHGLYNYMNTLSSEYWSE